MALLSNGSLITENVACQLAQYKDKLFVQVDLDGSTPEIHDGLRGVRGAFERTRHGIELLAEQKVRTRVAVNLVKENLADVETTLQVALRAGATWFTYSPVVDFGRAKNLNLRLTAEEVEYLSKLPAALSTRYQPFFNYLSPDEALKLLQDRKNCGAGYRVVVIGPTAKVRPCALLSEQYLTIGDLTVQGIAEVFSNPVVSMLYNLVCPNEETCGPCEHALYCKPCFTRAIVTQAKLKAPCAWAQLYHLDQWISIGTLDGKQVRSADANCRSHGCETGQLYGTQ